jgi:hypothetical protein
MNLNYFKPHDRGYLLKYAIKDLILVLGVEKLKPMLNAKYFSIEEK